MAGDRNTLLRTQTNEAFLWLRGVGGDPADFEWRNDTMHVPPLDQLVHLDSGHFFRTNGNARSEWDEARVVKMWWQPGLDSPGESATVSTWAEAKPWFLRWYGALRAQIDVPDPWTTVLAQSEDVLHAADPSDNSRFTADEKRLIAARVDAARAKLIGTGLDKQALADANAKLDYLVEASKRVGRFDWRNLAIGIVVDIGVASAFDTARAQELLNLLVGAARHLLGG